MEDSAGLIISLAIKVGATIWCVNKAKSLNRNPIGWGIFGFIAPLIGVIAVHSVKSKATAKTEDFLQQDDQILDSGLQGQSQSNEDVF